MSPRWSGAILLPQLPKVCAMITWLQILASVWSVQSRTGRKRWLSHSLSAAFCKDQISTERFLWGTLWLAHDFHHKDPSLTRCCAELEHHLRGNTRVASVTSKNIDSRQQGRDAPEENENRSKPGLWGAAGAWPPCRAPRRGGNEKQGRGTAFQQVFP